MAGKSDIVDGLVNQGLTRAHSQAAVEGVFGIITDALAEGERFVIPGFGTFSVSHRAERQGRNPQTGETITIKASNVARFKPAKGLKDAINA